MPLIEIEIHIHNHNPDGDTILKEIHNLKKIIMANFDSIKAVVSQFEFPVVA